MGYKGVICYNITIGKFIISKHIIHDESQFPYKLKTVLQNKDIKGSQIQSHTLVVIQAPIPELPRHQNSQVIRLQSRLRTPTIGLSWSVTKVYITK